MAEASTLGQALKRAKPGDVISSVWINELVDTVNDLQTRLASLEDAQAQGFVAITGLLYTSPLRLGDPLEIQGQNFGWSRGTQQVRFDSADITEFRPGSSDTRLLVTVPSFSNFPDAGREVALVVSDGTYSARRSVFILPAEQPISGNLVDVLWETITPNPMAIGQPLSIGYRLRSRVDSTRTFTITTAIAPAGLQSGVEVRDEHHQLLVQKRIELGALQEKLFFVKLTDIPNTLPASGLTITTSAVSGGVTGSDSRTFTVAGSVASDPAITLSVSGFSAVDDAGDPVPNDGSYDSGATTIRLRSGAFGRMELAGTFNRVGTYTVSLTPSGVVDGWTRTLDTGAVIVIEQNDLIGGQASRMIRFNLLVSSTASTGQIEVRVQRSGATGDKHLLFQLARLP
ncbi:MAG TPA: hypothetical protein DCQ94_07230 [Nitrospira sp.]|jgi:hypothetical protein|nr:hypothetical protein [Nitrospira sp.]